jgi:ELWxxDGT repeat protein
MSLFSWIRRFTSRKPAPAKASRAKARLGFEALEERTMPASYTLFAAGNQGGSPPGNIELWRTDGTSRGTVLLKDINPGRASSDPLDLTYIKETRTWYFTADNGRNGRELWKSNGTAGGTVMVRDIFAHSRVPYSGMDRNTAPFFTYCNRYVYFVANGGPSLGGIELWRTNGTASGTRLVKNIKHRGLGARQADRGR